MVIHNDLFSQENSRVMRGLAILAIMYHNLLHTKIFGFSAENEMSFSYRKVDAFLHAMLEGGSWGADIVSFLGWLGVPVFVFLTGYGLSKKYPPQKLNNHVYPGQVLNGRRYLCHCYLKLFLLMLPAVLFFTIPDLVVHDFIAAGKKLFSLTLLSNFNYPNLSYSPGIYWYFSLTFQLYVLFFILHKWFSTKRLFVWSIVSLVIFAVLATADFPWLRSVYRHCFTGWFPLYALGIWQAQRDDVFAGIGWAKSSVVVLCTAFLVFVMNLNLICWVLVPIVALIFFIALSKIVLLVKWLRLPIMWVGQLSAFVFVCHPIARVVANRLNGSVPLFGIIILYFMMTMLLAVLYSKLYTKLLTIFKV